MVAFCTILRGIAGSFPFVGFVNTARLIPKHHSALSLMLFAFLQVGERKWENATI
jgi:hypothetical protein